MKIAIFIWLSISVFYFVSSSWGVVSSRAIHLGWVTHSISQLKLLDDNYDDDDYDDDYDDKDDDDDDDDGDVDDYYDNDDDDDNDHDYNDNDDDD